MSVVSEALKAAEDNRILWWPVESLEVSNVVHEAVPDRNNTYFVTVIGGFPDRAEARTSVTFTPVAGSPNRGVGQVGVYVQNGNTPSAWFQIEVELQPGSYHVDVIFDNGNQGPESRRYYKPVAFP